MKPACSVRPVFVATTLALFAAVVPAHAHHGKDFLLVETYELPHPGQVFLLSNQDFVRSADGRTLVFSPAVLVGVTGRLSLEVHAHFEKPRGEDWEFEAVAPALRVQLTAPDAGPLRVGFSAEYEFGRGDAPDNFEGRLIVAHGGRLNVNANLVVARERGTDEGTEIGYAVGVRPAKERTVVFGAEAQGTLRGLRGHEVLAGAYLTPSERLTVKLGVGTGFGEHGPDLTVRTGIVFGF